MYGKLFQSLYQGTMRGQADLILVFTNLLAFKDKAHFVDKTARAISEEVGIPEDRVKEALLQLEAPDPESRSEEHEGRRIIRIDTHRSWGWKVVNGPKYDDFRKEEDRRMQWAVGQQRHRAGLTVNKRQRKSSSVIKSQRESTESTHIDIDIDNTVVTPFERDFAEFWSHYPRKEGKQTAKEAFEKVYDALIFPEILEAIKHQSKSVFANREKDKIPMGSTWLNQKRWEDDAVKKSDSNVVTDY